MKKQTQPVHMPHDTGYKYLLSSKKTFVQLLRCFVESGWRDLVCEADLIRIDKSVILPDFRHQEADLVYRAHVKDTDLIFYVLLELQSRVDFLMPYRLLLYMTEIWRDIFQDTPESQRARKDFRLPVIIPLVLYNAPGPWTAPLHFRETLQGQESFGDHVLDFRYHLIHVFSYREEELLHMSNLMGSVFLLDQAGNRDAIIDRMKKLTDTMSQMDREEFALFTAWAARILTRGMAPAKRDEITGLLINARPQEVDNMITQVEKALERERKKAEKQWMEKGMEKGMEEARLATARQMLAAGETIEKITRYTGLSRERVARLAEQGKE